jgi:hypothetical protein
MFSFDSGTARWGHRALPVPAWSRLIILFAALSLFDHVRSRPQGETVKNPSFWQKTAFPRPVRSHFFKKCDRFSQNYDRILEICDRFSEIHDQIFGNYDQVGFFHDHFAPAWSWFFGNWSQVRVGCDQFRENQSRFFQNHDKETENRDQFSPNHDHAAENLSQKVRAATGL